MKNLAFILIFSSLRFISFSQIIQFEKYYDYSFAEAGFSSVQTPDSGNIVVEKKVLKPNNDIKWKVGFSGSIQNSLIKNDDDDKYSSETSYKPQYGFAVDLSVAKKITELLWFKTGIRFNKINQDLSGEFEYLFCDDIPPFNCYWLKASYTSSLSWQYIQIPILFKQIINPRQSIKLILTYGASFSILQDAAIDIKYYNFPSSKETYTWERTKDIYTSKGFHGYFSFGMEFKLLKFIDLGISPFLEIGFFDLENKKYDDRNSWYFPFGTNVHVAYLDNSQYNLRPLSRNINYGLNISLLFPIKTK